MTAPVTFDIVGDPRPQGSKRAFVANGRAVVTEASGTAHASWRNQVATAARDATGLHWDDVDGFPLDGALHLDVTFRFPMPKSRPKRVREIGWALKTTAPDTSKLVRALEDGLQAGGLIVDDARFSTVYARKLEVVGWTGAVIRIERDS